MPSTNSVDEQQTQAWMKQEHLIFGGRYGHGMAKIDEHRMIIVGGLDEDNNVLSSGFIYDVRTQQLTPLLHDLPVALGGCRVVAAEEYVYVIGGCDGSGYVKTMYRLCLETFEWTAMAPMGAARGFFAAILKDEYIYVFGGYISGGRILSSTERYCIDNNTWEELADMQEERDCHCAISTEGSEIYIVGRRTRSMDIFDTATLTWKIRKYLRHMPEVRCNAAAVVLKNKYLVVIGGLGRRVARGAVTASCSIYDIWCNCWSSTPLSMDMIEARGYHTAAVLDGKVVVAGGQGRDNCTVLASVECIEAHALLEYAPLHYPLPTLLFNRILEIGKSKLECVDQSDFDKLRA